MTTMKTIEQLNDSNQDDYSLKSSSEYRRQVDKDLTYANLNNTDWQKESDYHNSYYVNGTWNKGRTIKLKK